MLGLLFALFLLLLAFSFSLLSLFFAFFLTLLGEFFTLFLLIFACLLFSLLGILLGLLCSLVGGLGRVFAPLVAEVTFFLLVTLGLLDGVLLGYLGDAVQFALVLLFLLDAVLDFLLAFAFGFLAGLGFALELLQVLFLGAFLGLALLLAELRLAGCDGRAVAVIAGLDLLALSLLLGLLLGLDACLLGGFGLESCFFLGLLECLGFGILSGEFGFLASNLLGLETLTFALGGFLGFGLLKGLLLGLVEFFLLEVAVFLVVLLLQVVEVVLEGAALVQQQVEVVDTDDDVVHLSRHVDGVVLLKLAAVVGGLLEVVHSLDYQQAQRAEVHLFDVIVLDLEGVEVVACHLIEQHVGVDAVAGIEQDEHLRLVVVLGKRGERALQCLGCGIVAQARGPQHAAHVAAASLEATALVELLDNLGCHGGDVGLRIALQHVLERLFELVVVLLGQVTQRVDEHELGHDLGQRVLAHHLGVGLVDGSVVVGQVVGIGRLVHVLLVAAHILEVLQIVGVLHGHTVLGIRELVENHFPIRFGIGVLLVAHVHHVHIIVHVQAVGVVGVQIQQLVELIGCGVIVLHLVLEDDAHIVESLLNDLVGRLDVFFGLGNLLEVEFFVVRVLGALEGLEVDFHGVAVLIDDHAVGHRGHDAVGLLVGEREGALVAAAPVVLEFAVTPLLLELRFTGILDRRVIEVP